MQPPKTTPSQAKLLGLYLVLILLGVFIFFVVRSLGESLTAPPPAVAEGAVETPLPPSGKVLSVLPKVDVVLHVLVTLAAVISLGYLLSMVLRRLGQPPVIGEVIAGILLGPSVLGAISPEAMHLLIPGRGADPEGRVLAALQTIAQLGIVLYMFLVGLELNTLKLRKQAGAAIAISNASIVFPFVLGSILALWLYPRLSDSSVSFTSFSLFQGVAMSITAFPVLARILKDRKLAQTDLGVMALGCAALNDVTAWCLLALVVGVAKSQLDTALYVALGTVLFLAAMFMLVRPLMLRLIRWSERHQDSELPVAILFVAVLLSAVATESIGIHAVFGPFLLGALIPHDSRIARELEHKLHDVVTVLLLPAFFAIAGMNTRIDLIGGWSNWLLCLAIIGVATLGKFGGTLVAARLTGSDWRNATALGVLMNTRGLMELIVLNIGLGLGVISSTLFAMMVLMALATTMMTSPILVALVPSETLQPTASDS